MKTATATAPCDRLTDAVQKLSALIQWLDGGSEQDLELYAPVLARLGDALDKLYQAQSACCSDGQWDLLDALLVRAENGGPCWYIDGKLVIERGESAPYAMYYGEDEMFHGTFQVAHFYAKALRVFGPTQAPHATLREFGVKAAQ